MGWLSKVGAGLGGLFGGVVQGVVDIANGNVGEGLAKAFVPGYASVKNIIDISKAEEQGNYGGVYIDYDLETANKVVADSVKDGWEDLGNVDLNNDGVTFSDHVDSVASFVEEIYDVDIPWVGNESAEVSSVKSGFSIFGFVIPASIIGLLFLL